MKKKYVVLFGLLIGLLLGGVLFLSGRAVVVRVRATPRPTPAPLARATIFPTPVPTKVLTPAPAEASISSLEQQARSVAYRQAFDKYQWTLLALPANTTSAEVLKHYTDEMRKGGWSGNVDTFKNEQGNLVWVWMEAEARNGLAVIYIPGTPTTSSFAVVISGEELPEGRPTPEF